MDWEKIAATLEAARNARALLISPTGTIFDGRVIEGIEIEGKSARGRFRDPTQDGQGMTYLRQMLGAVAILTNEKDAGAAAITATVKGWNELRSAKTGKLRPITLLTGVSGEEKVRKAEEFLQQHGLSFGDTILLAHADVDRDLVKLTGLSCAPANASRRIKECCLFVSKSLGGRGFIMDVAEMVAAAKGVKLDDLLLN